MTRVFLLTLTGFVLFAGIAAGALEPRRPDKQERCPVCGMFVAPYPDWTATIRFSDDTQVFFDGAKDLYRYYLAMPAPSDSRRREEISGIYLTDYYSTRLLPVEQLFLVIGSDVYGPMGHEFVPIFGEDAAKTFAKDHSGQQIIRFEQLTPQMLPVN